MKKAARKEQAIRDLANAYFSGVVGVTVDEALDYARFIWDQAFLRDGFGSAEVACLREALRYEDM